jgi:osmotically-inducible protein OsmY
VNALKWHSGVREEKIKIKVENGIVRLEGEVEWEFERNNAKLVIENLAGVKGVINLISINPRIAPSDISKRINAAFHRSATIDASKIVTEVSGSKIILRGKVRSFSEKEDAENAAWNAPGVLSVKNELQIEIPEYALED